MDRLHIDSETWGHLAMDWTLQNMELNKLFVFLSCLHQVKAVQKWQAY